MRRWILLATLIVVASSGGWTFLQRYRERIWSDTYGEALLAFERENYAKAENILVSLLPQTEKWWPRGPHTLKTMLLLGMSYRVEHKYEQAEPQFRRALEVSSSITAVDDTELGRIKYGLAIIARDRANDVEAQHLFSEAFEIFQKSPDAARGDDAGALLNLGFLCIKRGQYREAESFLNRSIVRYQIVVGGTPYQDLANAHFQLADVYRRQGRDVQAAEQFRKSLSMYERLEGSNGLHVGHALQGLAVIAADQGKTHQARLLLERSRKIEQGLAGSSVSPDGATLNNFANIANQEGKYAEAISLYRRSIDAYERTEGIDHPDLAIPAANLGRLYRDHEQLDISRAGPLLKRALALREKALGHEHALTVETVSDLALLYFYERNFAVAEKFAQRALPVQEKIFGQDSLEVSTTLNRLGISERELRKFPQAEANLKRALAIREKALAANHSWIAISLENLALTYTAEGQSGKAAPLMARARAIRSHPSDG